MNGCLRSWRLKKYHLISGGLLLSLLLPIALPAQQNGEEELPSLEMLEFLGTFEDEESGWINPLELLAMDDEQFSEPKKPEASDEE